MIVTRARFMVMARNRDEIDCLRHPDKHGNRMTQRLLELRK